MASETTARCIWQSDQAEDVMCDGAEALAWGAAAVPPLRQKGGVSDWVWW